MNNKFIMKFWWHGRDFFLYTTHSTYATFHALFALKIPLISMYSESNRWTESVFNLLLSKSFYRSVIISTMHGYFYLTFTFNRFEQKTMPKLTEMKLTPFIVITHRKFASSIDPIDQAVKWPQLMVLFHSSIQRRPKKNLITNFLFCVWCIINAPISSVVSKDNMGLCNDWLLTKFEKSSPFIIDIKWKTTEKLRKAIWQVRSI